MKNDYFRIFSVVIATIVALAASATAFAANPVTVLTPIGIDSLEGFAAIEPEAGPMAYEDGYEEVEDRVYQCVVDETGEDRQGVRFSYRLDQTEPIPILATCQAKGEGIAGSPDSSYSLYLDIEYVDGTFLYGQTYPFPVGDSEWTRGQVVVLPEKPIKRVAAYGLLRYHSGVASFKDFALYELKSVGGATCFDRVPCLATDMELPSVPRMIYRDRADEGAPFRAATTPSPMASVNFGKVAVLKNTRRLNSGTEELVFTLRRMTNEDVVFTFYYAYPIPAPREGAEWVWFNDPRNFRPIGAGEHSATNRFPSIGSGALSRYPFGVVAESIERNGNQTWGAAFGIGINPDFPAFFRIAANGATNELYVAYDLALTAEKPEVELRIVPLCWNLRTLGSSELTTMSFVNYGTKLDSNTPFGSTPFRAGFDVWRQAFPEAFKVRALRQGAWMAFAKISEVPDWQDFGFVFKEGDNEVSFDDENGLTTFRYTEPMTWWQPVPREEGVATTADGALQLVQELAQDFKRDDSSSPGGAAAYASALLTTGMRDMHGAFSGLVQNAPWCDGVVWSLNDAPGLVELAKAGKLSSAENEGIEPLASFEIKWNERIANRLYGPLRLPGLLPKTRAALLEAQASEGLDGEYVDSSEGYVTAELDYNRAFFAAMETPLTFSAMTRQPAIFRGLVAYEYVRKISEDVHARGKLSMANSTPGSLFWLAPQLDVLGTETNWNGGGTWSGAGQWAPMSDSELMYRRMMTCGKPYCFLMNTDFSQFSKECTELYMKRALAYGMFPSFFSANASTDHYFQNPELFERDRPLFKKYFPIIKKVAESGWEPEPCASSDEPEVYVERFGALPFASVASNPLRANPRIVYLTVFNDSDAAKDFSISLAPEFVQIVRETNATITELLAGEKVELESGAFIRGALEAEDVKVYEFKLLP
ncbi:MAG: hypothetical protein ACOX0A_06960 [Thermoguttaceae bacterium]|jgi:hypothetical protein